MQELFLIGILLFQAPPARPTGGVSGRVVFADGAPVTGTIVRLAGLPEK